MPETKQKAVETTEKVNNTQDGQKISFKNLEITTTTVMVYTNCDFNFDKIKENLDITVVDDIQNPENKVQGELYVARADLGSANRFRNQIHVRIFVIDKCVAVKIFKTGKLHLTGCKTKEHAFQAATEIVKKFREIGAIDNLENGDNSPEIAAIDNLENGDNSPLTITFEPVMINLGFDLDFIIDRKKLDTLVQKSGYNDMYSKFDPLFQTSVNLKMRYKDPEDKSYDQIILKDNEDVQRTKVSTCPKAKKADERKHTFLVFGGNTKGKTINCSKVIQSGRYYDTHMESAFNRFLNFIYENRDEIEMKEETKNFDISQLEGVF